MCARAMMITNDDEWIFSLINGTAEMYVSRTRIVFPCRHRHHNLLFSTLPFFGGFSDSSGVPQGREIKCADLSLI